MYFFVRVFSSSFHISLFLCLYVLTIERKMKNGRLGLRLPILKTNKKPNKFILTMKKQESEFSLHTSSTCFYFF